MKALCLQYTAFKEMLLDFSNGNFIDIDSVNNHGKNNGAEITFGSPFPHQASEAYLFMPPGYWPSVYDNTMYPSDFPSDLLSSMSGGTQTTTIPGSYTDGQYLMLYCIDDVWYKVSVLIKGGEVIFINDIDVSKFPLDRVCSPRTTFVESEIDIRPANILSLDSEMTVAVNTSSKIGAELTVRQKAAASVPTGILVAVNKIEKLDSEMFVWYSAKDLLLSELDVVYNSGISSEITVKRHSHSEIDAEITVKQNRKTAIDSEITVKRHAMNMLLSEIIIKAKEQSSIEAGIQILGKDETKLYTDIEILKKDAKSCLYTDILVVKKNEAGIDSEIYIPVSSKMAATFMSLTHHASSIDADILVAGNNTSSIDSELTVAMPVVGMESLVTKKNFVSHEIAAELQIAETGTSHVESEIHIASEASMEALVRERAIICEEGIPSEIAVTNIGQGIIDSELTIVANNSMDACVESLRKNASAKIDTDMLVSAVSSDAIDSEMIIMAANTMQTAVEKTRHYTNDKVDSEITIANGGESSLAADLVICASNTMETVNNALSGGHSEIECEIYPAHLRKSSIESEMMVSASNMMQTAVFEKQLLSSNIESEIIIGSENAIQSELYVVGDASVMETTSRNMKPVLKHSSIDAIKDAMGYSLASTANFGKKGELAVGRLSNENYETFRSVIGFDLAPLGIKRDPDYEYFGYEEIQKAVLKLYTIRPADEEMTIKLYQIDTAWEETKINYKDMINMDAPVLLGEYKAPLSSGEFGIDVTSVFADWNHKPDTYAFMLVVDTLQKKKTTIGFSSREGIVSPKLEMSYYETPENGDFSSLDCEIEIKPEDKLDSEITISIPTANAIDTEVEIPNSNAQSSLITEFEVSALVIEENALPSEIEPNRWDESSALPSEIEPNHWKDSGKIDAEIEVLRDINKGQFIIVI